MSIPFLNVKATWTELEPELTAATMRVFASGYYIGGPEVEAFETAFAAYCETKHAIGTGNGLDALKLILEAMGIGTGDEVIVPSHTFIATWLAVSQVGAQIVPVEPIEGTFNIDPSAIDAAITGKTRAIIAVHLYGQPADMDPILEIAERHGLKVIEDAAQAHGARYKGRRAGGLGHAAAWSCYPGKNLGAMGDAGVVTTNDAALAEQVALKANYGSKKKYDHQVQGQNTRLDPVQAAVLNVKLGCLDTWNARRADIAQIYTNGLVGASVATPMVPEWASPVWHLYVVRSAHRDALLGHLQDQGIQAGLHYPTACGDQPAYTDTELGAYAWPVARKLASEVLSLPVGPHMPQDDAHRVVEAVQSFRV